MKSNKSFLFCLLVALCSVQLTAQDDLYYDPSKQTRSTTTDYYQENSNQGVADNTTSVYDDEYYDYDDQNNYEYSSRIRRFHRERSLGWGYYDPFYTDAWMYDPWFTPGASIYVLAYNDYWSWRRWNRFNRWNSFNSWNFGPSYGFGYNNWCAWNGGGGWNNWNSWNNPYVFNNFYYDPYWSWNGFNPYYCPSNVFVQNNYYGNNGGWDNGGGGNGGFTPNTYVGPRRGGTVVNPGRNIADPKSGRVVKSDMDPNYERKSDKTSGQVGRDLEREKVQSANPSVGTPANPKSRVDDVQAAPTRTPKTNRGDDIQAAPNTRIEREPVKGNNTPIRKEREGIKREEEPIRPIRTEREPVRKEREGIKREEEPVRPIRTEREPVRKERDPVRNAPEPSRKRDNDGDRTFSPDRSERAIERSERSSRTEERPARVERNESRQERSMQRSEPRQERSSTRESRPSRSESAPASSQPRSSGGGGGRGRGGN